METLGILKKFLINLLSNVADITHHYDLKQL
jgi:hypothetical protein